MIGESEEFTFVPVVMKECASSSSMENDMDWLELSWSVSYARDKIERIYDTDSKCILIVMFCAIL